MLSKSVTIFFWIFDFHKVVKQYVAGEVEIFVTIIDNFFTNHLVEAF